MKTENEDKNSDNSESDVNHPMDLGTENALNETLADVFIIDKGKEFSRPKMVVLLDEYSRKILGFHIGMKE